MLLELQNGCVNPKTLLVYNKFIHSPHCVGGFMYPSEEDAPEKEVVEITFTHYMDLITVVFNIETGVGEVMLHVIDEESEEAQGGEFGRLEYCGLITVDRLVELLGKIPHIRNFMEDEKGGDTLH